MAQTGVTEGEPGSSDGTEPGDDALDLETIEAALVTAETGPLVFATLHTKSAIATINRIVSVFPAEQQGRVRVQLSFTLQAVISQRLLPALGGGRVIACEFLLMTPGVRNLVREGKLHQIESLMQVGQEKSGMVTMNQCLVQLVPRRRIDLRTAFEASPNLEQLEKMLKQAGA